MRRLPRRGIVEQNLRERDYTAKKGKISAFAGMRIDFLRFAQKEIPAFAGMGGGRGYSFSLSTSISAAISCSVSGGMASASLSICSTAHLRISANLLPL